MAKVMPKPRTELGARTAAPVETARRGARELDPNAAISADTIGYIFWREWWLARQRGDYAFLYDLTAPESQARDHFGPRDAFAETCSRKLRRVLGTEQGELRKMSFRGPDILHLIHAIDLSARERRDYDAERWVLARGPEGWRLHQLDRVKVSKERRPQSLGDADFPLVRSAGA